MNKLIFIGLMAAVAIPSAALAQTGEIRKDERKVAEQEQDLKAAIDSGDPRSIENQAKDVRKARQELREDRNDYANKRYAAPYREWTYASLEPGSKIRPRFYGKRYSVAHPDSYMLTRAKRNQRWVRYGDDLVLVNIRSGRVVEVASERF
jgi:Ni/Co efflux regulator RcnB